MAKINKTLLPAKGHYFAFCASLAGIIPFGGTIATQFGASPALVGTIYLTLQFASIIGKPSFGILADKLQQKKPIFLACVLLATTSFFAICFIPPVEGEREPAILLCQNQSSSLMICNGTRQFAISAEVVRTTCDARCNVSSTSHLQDHLCTYEPSMCQTQNATKTPQTIVFSARMNLSNSRSLAEDGCAMHTIQTFEVSNWTISMPTCDNAVSAPCNVHCDSDISFHDQTTEPHAYQLNSQIMYFWILMFTAHLFMASATSMADAIVLSSIPKYGVYGQQRLYGSIGYGLFAIVCGQLVDTFSSGGDGKLNFTPTYCTLLVFGVIDFVVVLFLTENKVEKPKRLCGRVVRLFLNAQTMLFTTAIFSVGFFSGILWTFLNVYLTSLRANVLLIGLCFGVQCFLGEAPFMFTSEWFLKKIGHGHAMTLVLAVFGIRFILYYVIDNPWFILPVETTQGICFGIFFTALTTYSSIIAPPSSQATMQGILQAVFEGLGVGTGSFFGGLIYQALGGKNMWLVTGVASCCLAVIHGLLLVMIQRCKKSQTNKPVQQEDGPKELSTLNGNQTTQINLQAI